MAKGPVQSGGRMPKPGRGTNGPNDKGGGTKTYSPPKPKMVKNGVQAGTK